MSNLLCQAIVMDGLDIHTDARRTKTCVAPRHVDASRDDLFHFFRTSSVEGGCAAGLFLFLPFSMFSKQRAESSIVNKYSMCHTQAKDPFTTHHVVTVLPGLQQLREHCCSHNSGLP